MLCNHAMQSCTLDTFFHFINSCEIICIIVNLNFSSVSGVSSFTDSPAIMGKIMKPNKVVLILSGKYAGRKAIVVKVKNCIKFCFLPDFISSFVVECG